MRFSFSIIACYMALSLPTLISASSLRPRIPQAPGAAGNITSYNSTSTSTSNSNSSSPSNSSSLPTDCPSSTSPSEPIDYPFILTANSASSSSSISLINTTLLGSTFHISHSAATNPQNQGVFVLSPDGTLQGGLNDQVHNAGNCTLLSYGYGDFATQFPSCAVGGMGANTDGTGASVVGQKWMARMGCVGGEDLLILLPDLRGNRTVEDDYFHSVPGSDPLLFHAQQDIYGELSFLGADNHAYLVIEEVEMMDLNAPYNLTPVEDIVPY